MIQNPYPGVNAHLNSKLQNEGGWGDFHSNYIVDIARSLKSQLHPLGYTAAAEEGLQIKRVDMQTRRFQSDVLVYDTDSERTPSQAMGAASTRELILPTAEMLTVDEVNTYKAIVVYEVKPSAERGEPVAWVELLLPSNKVGHNLEDYQNKRLELLRAGIVFVEIDLLHQMPPTFHNLPDYTRSGIYPYHITVIDPRPDIYQGESRIWQFGVADPIPTMRIPLSGEDALDFDFGAPYTKSFEEMLYGDDLDYDQLPAQFETYQEADQEAIRAVIAGVQSAL